jgi:probable H4MPT-linked C1 transfer pathway protein
MPPRVVGLDIGGANLKAAHSNGTARLQPFELWKYPAELPTALSNLLREMPAFDLLAVTMTGELCDCFDTRRQGVNAILDAVEAVAASTSVRVWRNDGQLVKIATARTAPLQVAAANWLALAVFAGRYAPKGPALLVDIGSTTTDVVPLLDGRPVPQGRTDPERLRCQELLYTGIRRTPVCALLGWQAAAELFATTLDAYLLLGQIAEDPTDCRTADGRPATRVAAHARLARMLGADAESFSLAEAGKLAEVVVRRQIDWVLSAICIVAAALPKWLRGIVAAGSGEFLLPSVLAQDSELAALPIISLTQKLGAAASQSACAYALAALAAEQATGRG